MHAVVPLFVLAAVVVVPFGLGLAAEGPDRGPTRLLRIARQTAIAAAPLLAIAYVLPRGEIAAVLTLPWLAVGAVGAAAGVWRFAGDRHRWRPGVDHAIDGALGFLLIGGLFAIADRGGLQPFGFGETIVLLTAVHFHVAGFGLLVAGAMTWRARPSRWLEAALGAVVLGIPLTALGLFGLPVLTWAGALLVAGGGATIGLGHLVAAGRMTGPSRWLLGIAGLALLASMPIAAAYATSLFAGVPGPSLAVMAAVHGGLNVLGFAVPAFAGWTLAKRPVSYRSAPEAATLRTRRAGLLALAAGVACVGLVLVRVAVEQTTVGPHLAVLGILLGIPVVIGAIGVAVGDRGSMAATGASLLFLSPLSFAGVTIVLLVPGALFLRAAFSEGAAEDETVASPSQVRTRPRLSAFVVVAVGGAIVLAVVLRGGVLGPILIVCLLAVAAMASRRTGDRPRFRMTSQAMAVSAAMAVLIAAGVATALTRTETVCWAERMTAEGLVRERVDTIDNVEIDGRTFVAAGCDGGALTSDGLVAGSTLWAAAIGLAIVGRLSPTGGSSEAPG